MITGNIYLDVLENLTFQQLKEDKVEIFQQDGAPPHYSNIICNACNDTFPHAEWAEETQSFGL
jgi:hypothetical protein